MNNIKTPGASWAVLTVAVMGLARLVANQFWGADLDVWFTTILNNSALVAGAAVSFIGFLATLYAKAVKDAKDSVVPVETGHTRGAMPAQQSAWDFIKDIL